MKDRIGQQFGNYRLIRMLGSGGFAEVYLGEHIHLGTQVAIKVLYTQLIREDGNAFLTEARTIARLVHPHIVRILDFGVEGTIPYLVMDYAPNGTLRTLHPNGTTLGLSTIVTYVKQVAGALQYAHDEKLIHRDVKPENMLLGPHNEVWLGDFGIAVTAHDTISQGAQEIIGTISYMAPERFKGRSIRASDQYSLAVVVYEWLSGVVPFQGHDFFEMGMHHLTTPPPPLRDKIPTIPPAVEAIVLKALAKDPNDRFAEVQSFARALEEASELEQLGTIGTRFGVTTEEQVPDYEPTFDDALVPDYEPTAAAQFMNNVPWIFSPTDHGYFSSEHNIPQLLEEGERYYKAKRYGEALAIYNLIIQFAPHEAPALGYKGNVLGKMRRYDEALVAYNELLAVESQHVSIWNAKGDVLAKLKRYQEAIVAYDTALALNSNDAFTWVTKGVILAKLKRYQEAINAYNKSIEINSQNAQAWINKGHLLSKLKLYEEALLNYDSGLALNPRDALIWTTKGKVLFALQRYEEALIAYTCAADITPRKAAIWAAKGEVLSQLKRYEEALIAYERAYILNPDDASVARQCSLLRDMKRHREELAQAQVSDQPHTEVLTQTEPLTMPTDHHDNAEPLASVLKDRLEEDLSEQANPPKESQKRPKPLKKESGATRTLEPCDVFLSYSHTDAEWVENLAKRLEDEHCFQVWLDKWHLIPGQPWQPALARALDQAKSCAVCIGEQTSVGWFKQEIQKALARQVKDPDFRVFAVLLPNAKDMTGEDFLQANTWVDFRNRDPAHAFHILASGIRGEPPGKWPPGDENSIRTSTFVEEMLQDLHRLRKTDLISGPIQEEYMRMTMEKVWFTQWTLKIKDNTHE